MAIDGIDPADLERLLKLEHTDPHSILGAHPGPDGVVIRALRPGAEDILVVGDGTRWRMDQREEPGLSRLRAHRAADDNKWRMVRLDDAGLFEVVIADHQEVFPYKLRVEYPDGVAATIHDPYSFMPTVGDLDQLLWNEGRHERIHEKLGAHVYEVNGVVGVGFAVWAPNARGVSVVGDFNGWDGRLDMMRMLGSSGIWEMFVPDLQPEVNYKFEIHASDRRLMLKADPFANATEKPPATASRVYQPSYQFGDAEWMEARGRREMLSSPLSIYEVHLGSWRRVPEEHNRSLTFREIAPLLADYVTEMGFTHVELLPVMEHPFAGSWGYQVTGYFAPTARWGTPDDFRFFVDYLHQQGIGVILDWVPAHFPTDSFALARFDGTALYEHLDPRKGHHPDWDTYIFNYGRNEVRNFLTASALSWLLDYHGDGLRVDAVASMLYLDYGRKEGEWIPNVYGGRENLEAVSFIKSLNELTYGRAPGTIMIAEESTSWAAVSKPTYVGGLGFGFKWDMGWMHDTLNYFSRNPVHRRFHQRELTFGFLYAWSENFILPLSHDEVVHGKASLLSKMPGDRWQQFANLRALYGYMWARPGKKMLFMGGEFGQWHEWNHDQSLDWNLTDYDNHRQLQALVGDLNRIYRAEPALWERDNDPAGFHFIDADNADDNVIVFMRIPRGNSRRLICVCNFSPIVRYDYRIGVPAPGTYSEVLNTDSEWFGGSNVGNGGAVTAESISSHGFSYSVSLTLPPIAVLWLGAPG